MKHKIARRVLAGALCTCLAVTGISTFPSRASETRVDGSAPFMGTWLVSGPFTDKVIDHIYGLSGSGGGVQESPEFNQTERIFGIGSSGSIKQGSANTCFTDGHVDGTPWQSSVESGPNNAEFSMDLEYPADVTSLQFYGFYEESETPETDTFSVDYRVINSTGVAAEGTVTGLTNGTEESDMQSVSFPNVITGVTRIEFNFNTTEETNGHTCTGRYYGMREVFVYGMPPAAPDLSERDIVSFGGLTATATSNGADAQKVLDEDGETAWQSETPLGDGDGWESEPSLTLELAEEKILTSIPFVAYEASGTYEFAVHYELFDEDGELLASGTKYNVTGAADDQQMIGLNYGITGVKKAVLTIDTTNGGESEADPSVNGLFGFRTVGLRGADIPADTEELTKASVSVTSVKGGNGAENAFDGNTETMWVSNNVSGSTWDSKPEMELTLAEPSRLDSLEFTFYEEFPVEGVSRHVSCLLYDSAGRLVYSGGVMATDNQKFAFDFGIGAAEVTRIELKVNPSGITNGSDGLGFREITINGREMTDAAQEPLGDISPVLGEELVDTVNGETYAWSYFDDRIFNRNQDDYCDLMGYFDVKQGLDTLNKTVAAFTYVYSEMEQTVNWQFAGSGTYSLFCNDSLVGKQETVPSDVVKSGTRYSVGLKEGWNKLLVEITHVNPSVACNLLGFYSRLCDGDGNEVAGLTYSVAGPNTAEHEVAVVTQGLDIDKAAFEERNKDVSANEYPENTLPIAYEKNPYVFLEATTGTAGWKSQASAFYLQAGGGTPGYTWMLESGELPEGLTLNEDGTITGTVAEGAAENDAKDYTFTVKVTDQEGNSATKEFVMTVKVNPVQWFEQGRLAALSHCTGTIVNLYDPNYNFDEWAATAKAMGMTMLSTESYQNSLYYWPSPNANYTPDDSNQQYKYNTMEQLPDGTWTIKDRVMEAKEAAERYGLYFGVYLSPQRPQSDIQGLVERYDPWYIFLDGNPQGGVNLDIAFSSARNYNDRILIDTNPNCEVSDQDVTLMERGFWNSSPYTEGWAGNIQPEGKYFVHEEWNDPFTTALDVWKIYTPTGHDERDSWPDAAKELISVIGHGYVMNYDSSIAVSRGMDNLVSSMDQENVYSMVPVSSQQLSDMRNAIAGWMANEGGPDLRESLYGTMPYYIAYTPKADWTHEPGTMQAFFHGEGPEWGYSLYRDQYVYLHMIDNYFGAQAGREKSGFEGQDVMEGIGPFDYEVESVEWLNEGTALDFTMTEKEGKYYIDIDTSSVTADPIDTILKIVTKDPTRNYKMTGVKMFSSQEEAGELQLRTECYMNDYVNVFAPAKLRYTSSDASVAAVDAETGLVTPVSDGSAVITVTASYDDGVNELQVMTAEYQVAVSGGAVYPDMELTGVGLFTNDKNFWNEAYAYTSLPVEMRAYTEYGGTIDLLNGVNADDITYHYAIMDGAATNPEGKVVFQEISAEEAPFSIQDGEITFGPDEGGHKYYAYWADVTVNGETFTTSRNYITLLSDRNVAEGIVPTVTAGEENAEALSDGIVNDETGGNLTKWTAPADAEDPSITFDLGEAYNLTRVNLYFNKHMPNGNTVTYYNVPKEIVIEYSTDGVTWTEGNHLTELTGQRLPDKNCYTQIPTSDATSYAWEAENIFYNYPIDTENASVNARYVRITFPGGGQNGSPIDILETRIYSTDEPEAVYSVTVDENVEHGTVNADKTEAAEGENVTLTIAADADYQLKEGSLLVNGGEVAVDDSHDGTYTFTMPAEDVTVTAEFEKISTDPEDPDEEENPGGSEDPGDEENPGGSEDPSDGEEPGTSDVADKSELKKFIEQADSLKLDGYTAETVETLKQALVKAKELMARENLSPEDQAEVDAAVKELKAAIDGLKPAAAGDGKDDGTTVNQPGKTGDSAPVAIWLGAALLALFAGAVVTLKMKRRA